MVLNVTIFFVGADCPYLVVMFFIDLAADVC